MTYPLRPKSRPSTLHRGIPVFGWEKRPNCTGTRFSLSRSMTPQSESSQGAFAYWEGHEDVVSRVIVGMV